MPPVEAPLEFDLTDALRSLDELGQAFDDIVANLTSNLDNAMAGLLDGATAFAAALDESGSGLEARLSDLDLSGMEAEIRSSIDEAVSSTNPEIDATLNIDTGTSADDLANADAETNQLADSFDRAQSAGTGAANSLNNLGNAGSFLGGAFQIATRDGRNLVGGLGQLGGPLGTTIAGVSAAAFGFKAFFDAGERATAANERLKIVFGDIATKITQIHVGGLNGDLSELAIKAGSSGSQLKQSAAALGELGVNSGKTATEVANTVQQVSALALRASVLNPTLGEAGAVAQRLNLALARGGRALARYNIDISAADITTRALADSGKSSARELTIFERAAAGAAIATEKLGTSIGTDFARGAEQSTIKLRSLKAAADAAFADAGKKLVQPTIDALTELQTVVVSTIDVLGSIANAVFPLVGAAAKSLADVLTPILDVLTSLPPEVLALGAAFIFLRGPLGGLTNIFGDLQQLLDLVGGFGSFQKQMETFGGRATLAIGAAVALDAVLGVLGTSTDELGLKFTAMGAEIGFAIGGGEGAAIGAGIGLIVDGLSALGGGADAASDAMSDMESQGKVLATALYGDATSVESLDAALEKVTPSLRKFIETQSRFKTHDQLDDLKGIGLGLLTVGLEAQDGERGLARFFDRAVKGGEISNKLTVGFDHTTGSINRFGGELGHLDDSTRKALISVFKLHEQADGLTKGTKDVTRSITLTGHQFSVLSRQQQDAVIQALALSGSNSSLVNSLRQLQKTLQDAGKEEFAAFSTTNNLSDAVQRGAKEASKGADGHIDYTKALRLLADAAAGIGPVFDAFPGHFAVVQRTLSELTTAIDGAVKAMPSLGTVFGNAIDSATQLQAVFGGDLSVGITNAITKTTQGFSTFFANIQTIIEAGSPALATALLQLGPANLGAQAQAQIAATQPNIRVGWETALQGFAQAEITATAILQEQKANIAFAVASISDGAVEAFTTHVHKLGLSARDEGLAIAYHFQNSATPAGLAAAKIIDAARTSFVASKIGGKETAAQAVREFNKKMEDLAGSDTPISGGKVADGAKKGFDTGKGKARTSGHATGHGYADGIDDTRSAAETAAHKTADSVAKILSLKGRSPSKITFGLGQNIGRGLALGILDVIPQVNAAALTMAAAATPKVPNENGLGASSFGVGEARAVGASAAASSGQHVAIDKIEIQVIGVDDPATARAVGAEAMNGALDAVDGKARRRMAIASRNV